MFLETCFTTLNYGTNTQTHPRVEIFLYEVLKNLWVQLDPFFPGSKGYLDGRGGWTDRRPSRVTLNRDESHQHPNKTHLSLIPRNS